MRLPSQRCPSAGEKCLNPDDESHAKDRTRYCLLSLGMLPIISTSLHFSDRETSHHETVNCVLRASAFEHGKVPVCGLLTRSLRI